MQIDRENIILQINRYLINKIDSGEYVVGEKIPSESVLCKELSVSRASLRTSISQFIALGLMKSKQGKGTYLISNDTFLLSHDSNEKSAYADVKNVLSFRFLIEPEATFLSVGHYISGDEKILESLKDTYKMMKENTGNPKEFIKADLKFHSIIAYSSGNEVLGNALSHIFTTTLSIQDKINNLFGFNDGLNYHNQIIVAFENKDPLKAKKLMASHLSHALESLESMEEK